MDFNNIFENAEFYMPGNTKEIIPAVDIVKEENTEVKLPSSEEALPFLEMSMLTDEKFDPSKVTPVSTSTTQTQTQENKSFDSNIYKALAEELASKYEIELPADLSLNSGEELTEFINTSLLDKKITEGINGKLESLGPHAKLFMDLNEYIGDEERTIAVIQDLNYYNSLEKSVIDSNTDLQKELITTALTVQGKTPEEIAEELEDYEALSKLNVKANEAKSSLIKAANNFIDKSKQAKLSKEENTKKDFASFLDSLEKVDEVSGLPVTKEIKEAVKKSISKPVYTDKAGRTYNEIANKQRLYKNEFEKAINFLNVLGLFSFDKAGSWQPDFAKLSSMATKKISKKLDEAISESQRFSKVGGEPSKGSLADVLASLD
jgi:hypothetical protein